MEKREFQRRLEAARKTNRERDEIDRKNGSAPPSGCPIDVHARTVWDALQCGLLTEDLGPNFEGMAMLEDLIRRLLPAWNPIIG